jgi:hypothetical protein
VGEPHDSKAEPEADPSHQPPKDGKDGETHKENQEAASHAKDKPTEAEHKKDPDKPGEDHTKKYTDKPGEAEHKKDTDKSAEKENKDASGNDKTKPAKPKTKFQKMQRVISTGAKGAYTTGAYLTGGIRDGLQPGADALGFATQQAANLGQAAQPMATAAAGVAHAAAMGATGTAVAFAATTKPAAGGLSAPGNWLPSVPSIPWGMPGGGGFSVNMGAGAPSAGQIPALDLLSSDGLASPSPDYINQGQMGSPYDSSMQQQTPQPQWPPYGGPPYPPGNGQYGGPWPQTNWPQMMQPYAGGQYPSTQQTPPNYLMGPPPPNPWASPPAAPTSNQHP